MQSNNYTVRNDILERMKNKLWQTTSTGLHPLVEAYTVSDDYITDVKLIPYDITASKAHASALLAKGTITKQEYLQAIDALHKLEQLVARGKFSIEVSQEDCHTAIEQFLTDECGEIGKKIHTGRSRNDQSLVMIRLYAKQTLQNTITLLTELVDAYDNAITAYGTIPMPGYTHMQKAMPTTVGTWLGAYRDGFADLQQLLPATLTIIDQNPLGSASGFGISNYQLDRSITTKELGFAKTQENPIYCAISRGYFENIVLQALSPILLLAGKFASDMLLFTTAEFNLFSLPPQFTTGSSIMPQKRNYDVFEIMRGNSKVYHSLQQQIQDIVIGFGAGYQRDMQLTKKPFIDATVLCEDTMGLLTEMVPNIIPNKSALEKDMTDELFVTNKVYDLVNSGMSFRDAYMQVKQDLFK